MSSRFTPLETAVLDALAWELSDAAPDLAGQFAESLPGQRRNTGSGLYTEVIVDRTRPAPLTTPSGRFGTVHAMVGDLPDPVAFQLELRAGRLLYLFGDAYGQDTRDIDFATVPFDQVFTIDAAGESVAFEPAALMPPSPLLDLHRYPDQEPVILDKPFVNTGPLQRLQDPPSSAPPVSLDALFGLSEPSKDEEAEASRPLSNTLKSWMIIGFALLAATVTFRLPLGFLGFFVVYSLVNLFRRPALMRELGQLIARASRTR